MITGFPRIAAAALPTSSTSKCEQAIPANSSCWKTVPTFAESILKAIQLLKCNNNHHGFRTSYREGYNIIPSELLKRDQSSPCGGLHICIVSHPSFVSASICQSRFWSSVEQRAYPNFIFHIQVIDDCVFFKYLVPRGEAYDKNYKEKLREDDCA